MKSFTIPLVVDDVKHIDNFQMTRCIYFSVEQGEPSPGWMIELQNEMLPLYLINISGVIYQPSLLKGIFDSPESIEKTFELIERNSSLYVATNDLWVPNVLFEGRYKPKRGELYRVHNMLFNLLYKFRLDSITIEELLEHSREYIEQISFSELENESFNIWSSNQVKTAHEIFPKNPEFKLDYKE
ncbi:MAG: hypothetical protein KAR21_07640 [Spirochaetales bacterium]|nr:hypothetical protein [Spirochaetales bacterium]